MNEYRSSHVFNYENVHEIIFLCGNMSYILSISFSWYSKGLNFTNEIMFFNDDFVYLMILKTSKYSTYVVLALSHHGKCVSTNNCKSDEGLALIKSDSLSVSWICLYVLLGNFKKPKHLLWLLLFHLYK